MGKGRERRLARGDETLSPDGGLARWMGPNGTRPPRISTPGPGQAGSELARMARLWAFQPVMGAFPRVTHMRISAGEPSHPVDAPGGSEPGRRSVGPGNPRRDHPRQAAAAGHARREEPSADQPGVDRAHARMLNAGFASGVRRGPVAFLPWCYRPRYLNIQRLNYLWMIRHSLAWIADTMIT
jgi:hypothetical protein